jgi:hypothetical protein
MRYKVLADNDGHRYVIAVENEKEFYRWVQESESEFGYDGKDFADRRMTTYALTFTDPKGWN